MHRLLLLAGVALAGLGASSCDSQTPRQSLYAEGDAVPILAEADRLPDAREGYAGLAAMTIAGSYVALFDPGTGPDDPPRFVRAYDVSRVIPWTAQVDANGFVWLGAPDQGGSGAAHSELYILDPHAATIHRTVSLPHELRGIAHVLAVGDDVYMRAWRNGFSGGVGVVPRACATDAARCQPRLLAELGNVGTSGEYAFHVRGDTLYSFSNANSRDGRNSLDLIERLTGHVLRSTSGVSGKFSVRSDAIHFVRSSGSSGGFDVTRMNPVTLDVLARAPAVLIGSDGESLLARQGSDLYTSSQESTILFRRDASTLAVTDTLRLPSFEGGVSAVFGFVAPDVLLLNAATAYDTRNGRLLTGLVPPRLSPGRAGFSNGLMLPQDHPLQR